jgi:hypothetical protein
MAKNQAYEPEHEKVVKVRFKPTFRRKDKDSAMNDQITLDQVEMVEVDESEEIRPHRTSIGDVTQAEKELILQEETLAGKIAAAELILQQREEAKKAVEKAETPVEETEMEEEKEPVFMEPVFMERPDEAENEEE